MHIEHSVQIPRPVKEISAAMIEAPEKWFPKSVGLHIAGVPVRKRVSVEFGEAVKTSTWAVIRLTWKATFPEQLFPVMHGRVDVSPIAQDETKLTVSGRYEPPLGKVGAALNDVVMHNVAQGTVNELAALIAERLEKTARP